MGLDIVQNTTSGESGCPATRRLLSPTANRLISSARVHLTFLHRFVIRKSLYTTITDNSDILTVSFTSRYTS